MLVYSAKLDGVSTKVFEGKLSYNYQFVNINDKGVISILTIKSDNDLGYKKGDEVEIPVSISCFENKIYYKTL